VAYQIAPSPMLFVDVHSIRFTRLLQDFQMRFLVQFCSSWRYFKWHSESRGPSAIVGFLARMPYVANWGAQTHIDLDTYKTTAGGWCDCDVG